MTTQIFNEVALSNLYKKLILNQELTNEQIENFKKVDHVMVIGCIPVKLDRHERFYTLEGFKEQLKEFSGSCGLLYYMKFDPELNIRYHIDKIALHTSDYRIDV